MSLLEQINDDDEKRHSRFHSRFIGHANQHRFWSNSQKVSRNGSEFGSSRHVSTRHDTFDVSIQSSSSWRACRAVLLDKLDTAKMDGLDTSNVSCWDTTSRAKWNLGLCKPPVRDKNLENSPDFLISLPASELRQTSAQVAYHRLNNGWRKIDTFLIITSKRFRDEKN